MPIFATHFQKSSKIGNFSMELVTFTMQVKNVIALVAILSIPLVIIAYSLDMWISSTGLQSGFIKSNQKPLQSIETVSDGYIMADVVGKVGTYV